MDTGGMSGRPPLNGRGRLLAVGVAVVVLIAAAWFMFRPSAMDGGTGGKKSDEGTGSAVANTALVSAPPVHVQQSSILTQTSSDPRAAKIRVGAVEGMLAPNSRGEFQQIPVTASASIEALVPFPNAAPGERIGIQAEDGGLLSGDAAKGFATVGQDHQVAIQYQASANDGLHRITLRRGAESRVLKFWVGPEPPILARQ